MLHDRSLAHLTEHTTLACQETVYPDCVLDEGVKQDEGEDQKVRREMAGIEHMVYNTTRNN